MNLQNDNDLPTERTEPCETAEAIAAIAPHLPTRTQHDLLRMLEYSIAAPRRQEWREARLGLLCELVLAMHGEVPNADDYKRLRQERLNQGEVWPAQSSLSENFGGWIRAVRTAFQLAYPDPRRNSTGHRNPDYESKAYTREELVDALRAARRDLHHWPSRIEYEEWRRLSRELARNLGRGRTRVPSIGTIERNFGTYPRAVQQAKRTQPWDETA
ncbi:hypothetical protein GKE82_24520 [Conexibacter sp. W3-3-2]|uniref:hypothetical protein n=1 Tax=Conexibacter sp. W3-3-2 TaxID=2675227 RepID=UPI0012B731AF|nr:hypothetical protein [Conexibacter sp. W3-3-2]MTD45596.1 hypothetical protein [Conexibacter sp. W3-3-2]MTD47375.1 hypothetical protein [Conexibacter sp. W3-3-2]